MRRPNGCSKRLTSILQKPDPERGLSEKSEENDSLTRRLSEQDAALKDARETLQAREEEVVNYELERKGHSKENARLEQMVKKRERELMRFVTNKRS